MNSAICAMLAALSVFDYPVRQARHEELRGRFIAAVAKDDAMEMEDASRAGAALLPEDPTWAYNLACSLAKSDKKSAALDALERAIRLGWRDSASIANDADFKSVAKDERFAELLELADRLAGKPVLVGPNASIPADGILGASVMLGEQNLAWDLDAGCYVAKIALEGKAEGGNFGDLYVNRDGGHSTLDTAGFPGLTRVLYDAACRERGVDRNTPNALFPLPVFGNSSLAIVNGPFWRSLPRAMMTADRAALNLAQRFYLSNQIWVFPAVHDCPPVGTNGDVFASVAPYWLATQGRSWSDLPYLKAALEASRMMKPDVKKDVVSRGLLAPTVMTLIRKSLKGVDGEDAYLTAAAHPTALPQDGVDVARLRASAAALTADAVPPLAQLRGIAAVATKRDDPLGGRDKRDPPAPGAISAKEITYATPYAIALVLRSPDTPRTFTVAATGADDFAFAAVHDENGAAKVERTAPNAATVTIYRSLLTPTNRVDLAVFGKNAGTGWGAPSYVSFAVVDPSAPYSDPMLADDPAPPNGGK